MWKLKWKLNSIPMVYVSYQLMTKEISLIPTRRMAASYYHYEVTPSDLQLEQQAFEVGEIKLPGVSCDKGSYKQVWGGKKEVIESNIFFFFFFYRLLCGFSTTSYCRMSIFLLGITCFFFIPKKSIILLTKKLSPWKTHQKLQMTDSSVIRVHTFRSNDQ